MSLLHIGLVSYLLNDDILHGFLLSRSKDESNYLSVVCHDKLIYEINSLFINVASHYSIFKVLKAVVDMNSLLDIKSWSLGGLSFLPRIRVLFIFVKLLSIGSHTFEVNNFFELHDL